jgi:hypothetical protein
VNCFSFKAPQVRGQFGHQRRLAGKGSGEALKRKDWQIKPSALGPPPLNRAAKRSAPS